MLKTFSGRRASQNEYELRSFIDLMKGKRVTKYLEIGARHGDTFHEIMTNLPVGSHGVAVDLPGGMWGKTSSLKSLKSAANDLLVRGYKIDLIIGDSQDASIINCISDLGPYDAVLIDGDHRYDGVKADWLNYRELSRVIAFHDIVGSGEKEGVHGNEVEVPRLWAEIKESFGGIEFVGENSKMGIGVCALP